jgi:hypothetical protein
MSMMTMSGDPVFPPRPTRFRERHPTLLLVVLEWIAAAGLIYLIVHRFVH